ncbi:hypothetical protein MAXJ12_13116 [Mesorhizobium alhagi CCNWXJ12-2]|uniref:Uncharacterized protein n=1 Tax=Mesorhizobium alhagi CCNWXJ12-2 TaxID=1107882 RepID=H0HR40_9HYPH|nr:hypothetical protein MAXJ12_13116 [Mesorhizobium alhagi CCNWXJ12-2]
MWNGWASTDRLARFVKPLGGAEFEQMPKRARENPGRVRILSLTLGTFPRLRYHPTGKAFAFDTSSIRTAARLSYGRPWADALCEFLRALKLGLGKLLLGFGN